MPVGTPGGDRSPIATSGGDRSPVGTPGGDATPVADGCHVEAFFAFDAATGLFSRLRVRRGLNKPFFPFFSLRPYGNKDWRNDRA